VISLPTNPVSPAYATGRSSCVTEGGHFRCGNGSMIRLGLRLTLPVDVEAALRVLITQQPWPWALALLACFAGVNGLHAQTDRGAWLDSASTRIRINLDS